MKKNILLPVLAMAATFAAGAASNDYKVTVNLPETPDGTMVYLTDFDNGQQIDSVAVASGKALFEGSLESPAMVRAMIGSQRGPMFVVESGNVEVTGRTATGTPVNEAINGFYEKQNGIADRYRALPEDATDVERQSLIAESDNLTEQAIAQNASNPFGQYLFLQKAYDLTPAQLKAALELYPQFKQSQRIQKVIETFDRKEATSAGKPMTDFAIEYNGKTTRLSDYVGKGTPVLVDFWASWCGPCRRESAVLKDIYAQYRDKGLEILGVAVWDDADDTLEAIEELQLPWPQIIDAKTVPTDLYGILGIPCIIMFDGNGTILFRDLQGDDLRRAVAEAMK